MAEHGTGGSPYVPAPDLIGLDVRDARDVCLPLSIVPVSRDQDNGSLGSRTWPGIFLVTAQDPEPGVLLDRWGVIEIDFERVGGIDGADDRLPHEPPPGSLNAHAAPEGISSPVEANRSSSEVPTPANSRARSHPTTSKPKGSTPT